MRINLILFIAVLFFTNTTLAQNKTAPRNLNQAIKSLQFDVPDSLKAIIKATDNNKLISLVYPWDYANKINYKTIYSWLNNDEKTTNLNKYLVESGIKDNQHQQTVILIAFKKHLLGQKFNKDSIFKPFQLIEAKWNKEDKIRLTSDSLRGVYIPKDIEDCFNQLNKFFNDSTKIKIKTLTEDDFSGRYHLGFGTWLRNSWGLWAGSRLSKYFIDLGINNPEDMSGIIFDSYHRNLLSHPIKLEEQIKHYKDYWEKVKQEELNSKTEKFAGYHLNDTVTYQYLYKYVSPKQEEDFDNEKCISKGIIIAKNEKDFLLKIRVIETCDKKGIITYDNINTYVYDKKLKQLIKSKKRIINMSHKNDELWMSYDSWGTK
jgi:hypothetical protein